MIIEIEIRCRRHRDILLATYDADADNDEQTVTVDSCDKCIAEEMTEIQEKNDALSKEVEELKDRIEILENELSQHESMT